VKIYNFFAGSNKSWFERESEFEFKFVFLVLFDTLTWCSEVQVFFYYCCLRNGKSRVECDSITATTINARESATCFLFLLPSCTHFYQALRKIAQSKSWVKKEIDVNIKKVLQYLRECIPAESKTNANETKDLVKVKLIKFCLSMHASGLKWSKLFLWSHTKFSHDVYAIFKRSLSATLQLIISHEM
jgi:hypothetical protein